MNECTLLVTKNFEERQIANPAVARAVSIIDVAYEQGRQATLITANAVYEMSLGDTIRNDFGTLEKFGKFLGIKKSRLTQITKSIGYARNHGLIDYKVDEETGVVDRLAPTEFKFSSLDAMYVMASKLPLDTQYEQFTEQNPDWANLSQNKLKDRVAEFLAPSTPAIEEKEVESNDGYEEKVNNMLLENEQTYSTDADGVAPVTELYLHNSTDGGMFVSMVFSARDETKLIRVTEDFNSKLLRFIEKENKLAWKEAIENIGK